MSLQSNVERLNASQILAGHLPSFIIEDLVVHIIESSSPSPVWEGEDTASNYVLDIDVLEKTVSEYDEHLKRRSPEEARIANRIALNAWKKNQVIPPNVGWYLIHRAELAEKQYAGRETTIPNRFLAMEGKNYETLVGYDPNRGIGIAIHFKGDSEFLDVPVIEGALFDPESFSRKIGEFANVYLHDGEKDHSPVIIDGEALSGKPCVFTLHPAEKGVHFTYRTNGCLVSEHAFRHGFTPLDFVPDDVLSQRRELFPQEVLVAYRPDLVKEDPKKSQDGPKSLLEKVGSLLHMI